MGVAPSSLITPNSEAIKPVGDGLAEDVISPLVRRVASAEEECFRGGEGIADAALEIRGILVGVSLGKPETTLRGALGSLFSFIECVTLFVVPTEGDPAIVGS